MHDTVILDRIGTELEGVEWEELPELVRGFTGHYDKLKAWLEYPAYLGVELNEYQLIIGFGDTDSEYWDGTLYWSICKDFNTEDYYSGEIRNGSPKYVIWELFDQFNEQLKKGN